MPMLLAASLALLLQSPAPTLKYDVPEGWTSRPVIEGRGGPYFIRLVGPAKTVAKWDAAVQAFFKSLRVE